MNYNDHSPPHFHAKYGDFHITVEINSGIIEGKISKRALNLIMEWYENHRQALIEDWELARSHETLKTIPPLD